MPEDRAHGSADGKSSVLGRLVTAARSGMRRYPRHLYHSFKRQPAAEHAPAAELDLCQFGSHDLSAVWIGHATTLMRVGGMNILTDPVFSHRIGMTIGRKTFGLGRMAALPLDVPHLPPIDLIVISHAHFDHLDKPSLARLVSSRTTLVTAAKTRRLIPRGFGHVVEVDWNDELEITPARGPGGVKLTALQPRHWGARTAVDKHRGYNSYLIEGGESDGRRRVLFAGDTAHTDAFDGLGGVDLAAMGIGAYEPWIQAHASPEQAWSMFSRMGGEYLLPMHHSTFDLGEEGLDEPMQRLLRAAEGEHHRIVCRRAGEVWGKAG